MQGYQLTYASGTGKPNLALSGNAVLTGGVISNSTTSAGAGVSFVKTSGTQLYSNSGTTFKGGTVNWTVQTNATLQPSGLLGYNLILANQGKIRLITNSGFQVLSNLTAHDNVVVADLGGTTPLANGTYPLMTYLGGLSGFLHAAPTIVNGSIPGGSVAYVSMFVTNQVNLVVATASTPTIASVGLTGAGAAAAVNLTATGGLPGNSYAVLASTNVALPLNQWSNVVAHGLFDALGHLSTSIQITNTPGTTNATQQYFTIEMPAP